MSPEKVQVLFSGANHDALGEPEPRRLDREPDSHGTALRPHQRETVTSHVGHGPDPPQPRTGQPGVPDLGPLGVPRYRRDMKSVHAPDYRALLAWLRTNRKAKGLSMRALGVKLGLPHSWVGKIETGERRLDVAEFVRLCEALEIDPHAGLDVVRRQADYPERPVADVVRVAAERPPTYVRRRKMA